MLPSHIELCEAVHAVNMSRGTAGTAQHLRVHLEKRGLHCAGRGGGRASIAIAVWLAVGNEVAGRPASDSLRDQLTLVPTLGTL